MTHDENTAMERSYHPTGAELWFLLSLLDDRPAPLFWPMGEPTENWPLVAVRLLDAGLAVRGENGLTPAAPLAPLLDTVKSADRAALVFLRTPGGAVDAVLYYNRVGGVLLRPGLTRYVAQKLQEQTAAAAGGVALAAAGSDCFREAAAVSSLLKAVFEPFAAFRACSDFLRAQEAQAIADELPEQAFIVACVRQSVLHGWRHGLLPGRIACGERLADGGGAGERAADFRRVIA